MSKCVGSVSAGTIRTPDERRRGKGVGALHFLREDQSLACVRKGDRRPNCAEALTPAGRGHSLSFLTTFTWAYVLSLQEGFRVDE